MNHAEQLRRYVKAHRAMKLQPAEVIRRAQLEAEIEYEVNGRYPNAAVEHGVSVALREQTP